LATATRNAIGRGQTPEYDKLARLERPRALYTQGLLSEDGFTAAKAKLLIYPSKNYAPCNQAYALPW
jgi:hypothetical protein